MKQKIIPLLILMFFITGCSTIRALAGGEYDNMKSYENDDAMMNDAIQQAQDTLPIFIDALQNPQPGQTYFSIKAKLYYGDDGSAEHIWLYDVTYADEQFSGYIGNTPIYIDNLKYGDPITISIDDVSDWMIIQDDRLLGGYTMYVILGEMDDEGRQDVYDEYGFWLSEQPVTE